MTYKIKKSKSNNEWKDIGLRSGDREGLIELIQRDTYPDAQNTFMISIGKGDMIDDPSFTEEDFQDVFYDELKKLSDKQLIYFYKRNRFK